jgi:hypothetical protein
MRVSIGEPDWLPWAGTVWPHDPEPFFARVFYDPWDAASTYPSVTYCTNNILNVLATHPGRLGPMAAATLAAGLAAREVGYRTQAVDALTNLVPDRLSVELLAEAMTVMAQHCPANRWAAALRDAASTAPAAAVTVVDLLAELLPNLPHDHNGVSGLLETLQEEALRTGHYPVRAELRAWLANLKGGSKSAKVAKAILADMGGGS